jgi:hypothetical protein
MKKAVYSICVLMCLIIAGCGDAGSADKSDPEDIVGTWIVNKVEKDGKELSFTDGEFQFTASKFSGWIENVEGMGDGTFAGDYTADGNEIAMDITVTDNTNFMDMGAQVWEYRADPSRVKIWYDNSQGYRITIRLEQ